MLNCNYPQCKKHKTCNLHEPLSPLATEIRYWLKELWSAEKKVKDYERIVEDIVRYHKYSIPINVYGHIEYAPKTNVFGVFIRRPEHVYYGWNISVLKRNVKKLTEKVKELRMKELEMMR